MIEIIIGLAYPWEIFKRMSGFRAPIEISVKDNKIL